MESGRAGNQYWASPKDRLVHGPLQALHAAVINTGRSPVARCCLGQRCCIILVNPIREIEGGKEIQEGKARRRVSQEEGDEEGEAGQESEG